MISANNKTYIGKTILDSDFRRDSLNTHLEINKENNNAEINECVRPREKVSLQIQNESYRCNDTGFRWARNKVGN